MKNQIKISNIKKIQQTELKFKPESLKDPELNTASSPMSLMLTVTVEMTLLR